MRVKIVLATLLVLLTAAAYFGYQWTPPRANGEQVTVDIPQGASSQEIGTILSDKGLIRSSFLFRIIVKWGGHSASMQAGTYVIRKGSTITEILDMIKQGKAKQNVTRFTIPEGFTIEQIADILAKKGLVNRDRLLREADTGTFDFDFVKQIPKTPGMKHRLEGYLFPDTYEVKVGASEHEILSVMLAQFDRVVTPDMRKSFQQNRLSLHEAVTMASLVEREAKVPKERPTIAGVIFNRLHGKPQMLLQIDATIQYVIGQKQELLLKDLEIDSPYNTYKREGLPPGPIASPGKDSLWAVAHPEKHEYYYYVTKKDGSGEHYFAKTLDEHNKNIAISEQNK